MLDNTIASISTYSDLIIFFAYTSIVAILIYYFFIKLHMKLNLFFISFSGFILVSGLNHLAIFLNSFNDVIFLVSILKILKAFTALLATVTLWPFVRDALYLKSLTENERQKRDLKIFKEAYEDASIGLALLDKQGQLLKANKELIRLFGYGEEYTLHSNIYKFINKVEAKKNEDLFKKIYKSSDEVFDFKLKFVKNSGEDFWGKVQLKVHRKDSGEIDFISVQITDITRELEIEKELQRERVNAENDRKLEYLKSMASSVAHEINNPLTIISGAAQIIEILLKKEDIDKEKINQEIKDTTESVLRISKIIKSLKMLSSEKKEQLESIPVSSILDNVIELCQAKFVSNGVTFEVTQDEGIFLKKINCNKMHMSQVLINMLNNSFEALENLDEKWINIKVYQKEHSIVFDIVDSGHGINEENKSKIYLPFYTTKSQGENAGLGLSYSKSVIQNYNGSLELIEDKNTTFRVSLPFESELEVA